MTFGLTRGELLLVAIIFGLIYLSGLLPKLVARLSKASDPAGPKTGGPGPEPKAE